MEFQEEFRGRTILITGAASGIGRATARMFAAQGAEVLLLDCQGEPLEWLQKELRDKKVSAHAFLCDVSDSVQVARTFEKIRKLLKRLDFAFNNAGVEGHSLKAAEYKAEQWERTLHINLNGTFWMMQQEIPWMLEHNAGVIVNCASIAGLRGFSEMAPYVASKHAVIGLTRSAALDYAAQNLRINTICPGVIQTPMIDRYAQGSTKVIESLKALEPMGRIGSPEEIASAVLWLCSSGASFVTGTELVVDGGWCAK